MSDDAVLEQAETAYHANGMPQLVTTRQRFHGETAAGELASAGTSPKARVSYVDLFYDRANRLTDRVDVGTNGGSSSAHAGSVPSRSDTTLVSSYWYKADAVQRVSLAGSPTGGTFTLSFGGYTTSAIAYDASAATVQSALEGLTSIGSGNVKVLNTSSGVWLVRFVGAAGDQNVPRMTAASGLTGGTAASVAIDTPIEGGDGGRVARATSPREVGGSALVDKTDHDLLGRTLRTTEAYFQLRSLLLRRPDHRVHLRRHGSHPDHAYGAA